MRESRTASHGLIPFIAAFFAALLCISTLARADSSLHPRSGATMPHSQDGFPFFRVEQLDGKFFRLGTARKLMAASSELMRRQELTHTLLVMQIEHGFDQVAENVDGYLDWYYSLEGEYMRLYKMATGERLENYIREKLVESLQNGRPFDGFERALQAAVSSNASLLRAHEASVQRILDQNRVRLDIAKVSVVMTRPLDKLIHPSLRFDYKAMRSRLLVSGARGSVSRSIPSAVTDKILEKVDSNNILKLAAKALAKFTVARATGSLGGASAGAAVGSAVPGIGTAVGAVVGIVVGGAVIDKGLLTLEESMNRAAFAREIRGAIVEAQTELWEAMKPEPSVFFVKTSLSGIP